MDSHMKATSKMLAKRLIKTVELADNLQEERNQLRKGLLLSLLLSHKWVANKKLNFDRHNTWVVKIGRDAIPRTELCKHETMVTVGQISGFGSQTGKLYSVRKALEDAGIQPPSPTETLDALMTVAINVARDTDGHTFKELN